MANLQAATTSDLARVTNPEAVAQLCEQYAFAPLEWELSDDEEFGIWGYDSLNIYGKRTFDDGEWDINFEAGLKTHDLLHELAAYIAEGEELDIQSARFTNFRYSMYATRYVVRPIEILQADLHGPTPLSPEKQPLSDNHDQQELERHD